MTDQPCCVLVVINGWIERPFFYPSFTWCDYLSNLLPHLVGIYRYRAGDILCQCGHSRCFPVAHRRAFFRVPDAETSLPRVEPLTTMPSLLCVS